MTSQQFITRRPDALPVILAAEAAECGLACLSMVARAHGKDVDLNAMRQRFSLSLAGVTLGGLMGFADQLGLAARAVKVELEALRSLATPAILHWDLNHFVVLKSINRRRAVIHDPAFGARTLSLEEVSKHFTGVALELAPTERFERVRERSPIGLNALWSRMVGFWPSFLQILLLSALLQVVAFAAPFQLQLAIDEGVLRGDADLLVVLTLAGCAIVLVQVLVEMLRGWSLKLFTHMLGFQMIGNLVRRLMRLPADWFEKRHVGDILSRMDSATAVQDVLTRGLISALIDGLMALSSVAILMIYSSMLTLVVLAAVLINFIVSQIYFPFMRARTEERLIESSREQSHLVETVRSATTTKLMGREAEREGQWRNLHARVMNASISLGGLEIGLGAVQSLVTGLQTIAVIYLGSRMILDGAGFSVGMLMAFLSFRQTFTDRVNALIGQFIQFRFIRLHLDRVADIVTTVPDSADRMAAPFKVKGDIRVEGVSFRYGEADRMVLENIDLNIAAGEFVAISGPSGGGKSTLMRILLGLREPTTGRVFIDGRPAAPGLWRAWREHVGVVSQDDQLMSGTIADNIAFFDPNLDMDRVREAAELALVHDDITMMPMQYMSLVGDMGSVLSGGQRQRVLLARALYRRPQILVLDEGTANLDVETEEKIVDLVARLPMTRIAVAHRPALLRRAQRVYELRNGVLTTVRSDQSVEPARRHLDVV